MSYHIWVHEPYEGWENPECCETLEEVGEFLRKWCDTYLDDIAIIEGDEVSSWDYARKCGLEIYRGKVKL